MPGHTMGGNGGTQTNLVTSPNQFMNRTTGAAVPAGVPYHVHNGQAMAGATHAEHQGAAHDFYDPMPSTGTRTMMNTNMVRPVRTRRDSQRRQTMSMSTSRRTSSMGGGGYRRGGRTRRRMQQGGHVHNVSSNNMVLASQAATMHTHNNNGFPQYDVSAYNYSPAHMEFETALNNEAGAHVHRTGIQASRRMGHGGMMRNGNGCPAGMHMMPDGSCMEGEYHGASNSYRHGGYHAIPGTGGPGMPPPSIPNIMSRRGGMGRNVSQSYRRGGRPRRRFAHGGYHSNGMRNGCGPGEMCHGGMMMYEHGGGVHTGSPHSCTDGMGNNVPC